MLYIDRSVVYSLGKALSETLQQIRKGILFFCICFQKGLFILSCFIPCYNGIDKTTAHAVRSHKVKRKRTCIKFKCRKAIFRQKCSDLLSIGINLDSPAFSPLYIEKPGILSVLFHQFRPVFQFLFVLL